MGAEKFMDIKCRVGGLNPKVWVMVATVRALKYHGGVAVSDLKTPDTAALQRGFANLSRHLDNAGNFGIVPVVAINCFDFDTEGETAALERLCAARGIRAVRTYAWAKGGEGCEELAREVVSVASSANGELKTLYDLKDPLPAKISAVAQRVYGAAGVEYAPSAKRKLALIESIGLSDMAVCIAKTQKSFTDNERVIGAPSGFDITIRDIEIASGAGFVVPIAGNIMRMPGLPSVPAAAGMDIDEDGTIHGLS